MSIRIFNSLTKEKEELVPFKGKTIKMYSCGVTVYDQCHIGHARSLYIFDMITRYLKYRGFDVHFVRNITDIDDKIINKANELKIPAEQVALDNIRDYQRDLKSLGIRQADAEPKATENINEIIDAIASLIQKGFAYEVGGDVYYSVRKFSEYGKLSGQSIEKMLEGVRIDPNERKKDPLDFALWKKSKEGEPSWDSPWGKGRPGWHIECTCMSLKHLHTDTLDIHAGGRDLIFPHHENELAQSEALTGKMFAKYWIHHGLLTINGQKMSKSLGNFITIEQAVQKYSVDTLKMFFLSSHYASPVDYSDEKMQEAYKTLQRFDILFWKASEILQPAPTQKKSTGFIEKAKDDFVVVMDDDFNTPKALAVLFELLNDTNKYIDQNKADKDYKNIIWEAINTVEFFLKDIFGLYAVDPQLKLSPEQEKLLQDRIQARTNKNFKRSDEIRDLLKSQGIIVEDAKQGQTWRWA